LREADLYPIVKSYLERQGYLVKAEVGYCDAVAVRGKEPPVAIELKLRFSLDLVYQGIARQRAFNSVYVVAPIKPAAANNKNRRNILNLCSRLGLGLLAVDPSSGAVKALVDSSDPGSYKPRRRNAEAAKLLAEFERRVGDPNIGGTSGAKRVTAYRQDALRLARAIASGPNSLGDIRDKTGINRAGTILRANHYGWFERVDRGIYRLTQIGVNSLSEAEVAGILKDL
jgi:hypothetical protein